MCFPYSGRRNEATSPAFVQVLLTRVRRSIAGSTLARRGDLVSTDRPPVPATASRQRLLGVSQRLPILREDASCVPDTMSHRLASEVADIT